VAFVSNSAIAAVATAVLLVACGSDASAEVVDLAPWDEPVPGAVAITAWRDEGQPVAPFGPDGLDWRSPEELVAAMAEALATDRGARTTGEVVERRDSGAIIGWVRLDVDDEPVTAGDFRLEMRGDGSGWSVVRTEIREHCTRKLVDGECE
jgi:hypothetical protein